MFKAIATWWKDKQQERRDSLMFERQVVVEFNGAGVSATLPTGETQAIAWQDVTCVAVETNDSGPWGADVWWLLEGKTHRVSYPQGAIGDSDMLGQFSSRFPGFNHSAVIAAMSSTANARFVCWERRDGL